MSAQPTPGEVLNGESVRLLPCPFCAGPASARTVLRALIRCDACGAESRSFSTVVCGEAAAVSEAAAAWNYRPQPSGSQDGGGAVQARNKILAVHKAFVARHGSRFIPSSEYFDAIAEALASPAKATGWPERAMESLTVALDQAKRGADKAGCDGWRAQEMCRQIVPLIESALALFPRPEDEGAA
jgi:hypothetical protein